MKATLPEKLERGRITLGRMASDPTFGPYGMFQVHGPCRAKLTIMAAGGEYSEEAGWEHVSVSTPRRPPNWQEMCFVKSLFWDDEETVMQLHPPRSQYINNHPHCLHLWRPIDQAIPLPPSILVGVREHEGEKAHERPASDAR